ncbi:MAG: protein kinase [Gaiellaceae bacterium]
MVGELIAGRYELEERVGSGGMASVYRAHDRLLERRVAVKILHEHFARDHESVERFQREARSVAQLAHPNIVTVIDRGEENGRPYIVFEYVEGENLKQLIGRRGPLPVGTVLDLAIQVARALESAHERGVVHRDVKPQNVLLTDEGRAKVTDFGIARARDTQGMTLTGTVLGTSDYIPPEQARGESAGELGDVYSLGAMLFELLTGDVPYEGENPVAVAMRHVNDPVPSARERRPEVPPRLDALVGRALAKSPQDRFASMREVIAELEACRADGAAPDSDSQATFVFPPAPAQSRRRGRRAARALLGSLVAVALVAAAAVGAYVFARSVSGGDDRGDPPRGGAAVRLIGVDAYDPEGDETEHGDDAALAADGDRATFWRTEEYRSGLQGVEKSGVGVVLDAGRAAKLSRMTVVTDTPGFTAEIRAGRSPTGPFETVSDGRQTGQTTRYELRGGAARYYLVWITHLGPNSTVHVNELRASG